MAFTTVTGSNGVTSLVGTTGVDVATIVTLDSNVFVGGNTGDDNLTLALAAGNFVASDYVVRMGGGDDTVSLFNTVLNSFISMDGEELANDGNDTFNGNGQLIINSEILGLGGNDVFTNLVLNGSTVNGNSGDDNITLLGSSASFVYGGADTDIIQTAAGFNSSSVLINGNKGSDTITLGAGAFASGSIYGGNGNDTISAVAITDSAFGNISITAAGVFLSGDLGDDLILGSNAVDTINGGDGADTIFGNAGADVINGGAGNDRITGGTEADVITGGAGNDIFVYAAGDSVVAAGESTGFDTITDFAANTSANTNGDRIGIGAVAGAVQNVAPFVSLGGSLSADLGAAGLTLALADTVATVTITGAVAWAGNYVVIGDAAAGYNAADTVIKVNTLNNITAGNIANVIGNF